MTKFIINKGGQSERHVEAQSYDLRDGYFWFVEATGEDVATFKAENVHSIRSEDK